MLAFQLAEMNNLKHYSNENKKMASWVWFRSLMKRNHLSLGRPEATLVARTRGLNRTAVGKLFDLLDPLQVGKITSAERGILCTAVICICAEGIYSQPLVIFPRARAKEEFSIRLPS